MGFRNWIAAVAVAGIALAPSAALAQTAKVDDGALKSRIETRLKASPTLKNDDIKVDADHGVVRLSGTVHSQAQRATAGQLAKVAGVARVENKLEVEKAVATSGRTMDKAEATPAKKDGAKTGAPAVVEPITDAWITTRVKTDFNGVEALKDSDISVDTVNHIVTLKGTVASKAGRSSAVRIAKKTRGVTKVVNNLIVVERSK